MNKKTTSQMHPEFHRKTIDHEYAKFELAALKVADDIDPDDQYHVGHALIEGCHGIKTTLRFRYGGKHITTLYSYPKSDVIRIIKAFSNILRGLSLFNQHGFYHLDVKLPNILFNRDNDIFSCRLVDFGVAESSVVLPNEIFKHVYTVWPFEVHMLSGENQDLIFTDNVFRDHIKHDYFDRVVKYLSLDVSDIRDNIAELRKLPNVSAVIYNGIDVYSAGLALTQLLSTSPDIRFPDELLELCRNMVCFHTQKRISISDAASRLQVIAEMME